MNLDKAFREFCEKHRGVLNMSDLQTLAKFIEFLKQENNERTRFVCANTLRINPDSEAIESLEHPMAAVQEEEENS